MKREFDHYGTEYDSGHFHVYGWTPTEAQQIKKNFLGTFDSLKEAQDAFPGAKLLPKTTWR